MNLYEIDSKIMECFDPETGELLDEQAFENLSTTRSEKLENLALWIKDLNAESAACKAEAKNFTDRAKTASRKAESLKKYLSSVLNGQKFSTDRVKITWRKSTSVSIDNVNLIPDLYKTRTVEDVPNKLALKEALNDGLKIDGCSLVVKENIQVK